MSYIGVPPVSGDFVVLDAITTSATASYTLQRSSVNFAPESANHMLVSLNGTIQKPNSSFTISGSTITFSSALTSSDVIDFILVLGHVNAVSVATTVADSAITNAKTNFVSTSSSAGLDIKGDGTTDGTLRLLCSQGTHGIKLKSPAHSAGQSYTLTFPTSAPSANKFLQTDGSGNLSFAKKGAVVQTVSQVHNTQVGANNQDVQTFNFETSITPQSSTNSIIAFVTVGGLVNGSSGRLHSRVRYETTSGGITGTELTGTSIANDSTDTAGMSSVTHFGKFTAGTTSALYVKNTLQKQDSGTQWYAQRYSNHSNVVLMEIEE